METSAKAKYIRIIGPESTGKTRLCEALAIHFFGIVIKEYARTYFETHSILDYDINDVETIYREQHELELLGSKTNKFPYLFIDSSFITAQVWCEDKFSRVPNWIIEAAKMETADVYLLCDTDLPWVEDNQRKNAHNRKALFKRFETLLQIYQKPYVVIKGIGEARVEFAKSIILQK
jgi:nicotinamide riboside kinase